MIREPQAKRISERAFFYILLTQSKGKVSTVKIKPAEARESKRSGLSYAFIKL